MKKFLPVACILFVSSLGMQAQIAPERIYVNRYKSNHTTDVVSGLYVDSMRFGRGKHYLLDTLVFCFSDGTQQPFRTKDIDSITFVEPRELMLKELEWYDSDTKSPLPAEADYYRSISGWSQRAKWNLANVHDPSVMKAADGYYYMYQTDASFGNAHEGHGHFHARRSRDLVQWEYLGATMSEADGMPDWELDTVNAFLTRAGQPSVSTLTGLGYWAPVARKVSDGLYRMYYCLVNDQWNVIGLMETADPASNKWEDRGYVIASASDKAPSAYGTGSQWGGWFRYNAIDPSYIITPEGEHWLVYGSWHSGIVALQLNPLTGKPLADPGNPWSIGTGIQTRYGQRIATRDASSRWQASEGPEIIYNDETGYYYLFLAYDELSVAYNTRVCRAKKITGPYYGMDGTNVTAGGDCYPIVTHPYRFNSSREVDGWVGISHCGVVEDGQGHWYYVSQGRLPENYDGDAYSNAIMMGHVRRILWTADGWPLVLPERYGAVPQPSITADELVGTWEHIVLAYSYQKQMTSRTLVLKADGTLSGPIAGKWSFNPLTGALKLGSYTVYVSRELDWEASPRHSTIVYAGYSSDGKRTLWGKKVNETD